MKLATVTSRQRGRAPVGRRRLQASQRLTGSALIALGAALPLTQVLPITQVAQAETTTATKSPSTTTSASTSATTTASASPSAATQSGSASGDLTERGELIPPGTPPVPTIPAEAWLVADLDTGQVWAAKNAGVQLPPASTIKALTAATVIPKLDLNKVYTATQTDASIEGSKVGLVPGSEYTVKDLLHGLMLASGNDCANALAMLSGGVDATAEAMTSTAKSIGATSTVAKGPSGLDAPGQVTTVHDMALIAKLALSDETVAAAAATKQYQFPRAGKVGDPLRQSFPTDNHNRMLFGYDGAIGLKTGYTVATRHTYIGAAKRGDRRLVVTVLKAEGRPWKQAQEVLNWAFALPADTKPVGKLNAPPAAAAAPGNVIASGPAAVPQTAGLGASNAGQPSWLTQALIGLGTLLASAVAAFFLWRRSFGAHQRAATE